jgi:two-component system, chemotaxis family, protein-glutamate methylesterase/glutaminase
MAEQGDTGGVAADGTQTTVELVALLASAGGLDALSAVLGDLPAKFPAAVVVHQHLGGNTSVLPTILRRRTRLPVNWAVDRLPVAPGQVVVCPPGMQMEVTPDGRCHLRVMDAPRERRFDVLMTSLARSYGPRSLAVVLSGSGHDGAVGTATMRGVGAIVIAQSADTAEYPTTPVAAAEAGADLVLPIREIGHVVTDIVTGASIRQPTGPGATGALHENHTATTSSVTDETKLDGAAAADYGTVNILSAIQSANSPAFRAQLAALRAAELRRRREDLASGLGATVETVATARIRAQESKRRAQLAHQAASHAAALSDDQRA